MMNIKRALPTFVALTGIILLVGILIVSAGFLVLPFAPERIDITAVKGAGTFAMSSTPFLIGLGGPIYWVAYRFSKSRIASSIIAGIGAAMIVCIGFYLWVASMFYVPTKCQASADARRLIENALTGEEAKTLKTASTMTEEGGPCSLTFVFVKDGREVEVSAMVDMIHGLKFLSSDNEGNGDRGSTAERIVRQKYMEPHP